MEKLTRNTKQKKEIIDFLVENKDSHIYIQDIKKNISQDIGLTTIYRVINQLVNIGQVIKKPLENGQGFCYQYNEDTQNCKENNHYHLICEICNKLYHYNNSDMNLIYKDIEKNLNFKVNNQKVVFYGKCNNCI